MALMTKINGLTFEKNRPPHVMGILNLSPESFYKGSVLDSSSILDAALKMVDDGASLLDVGARSTAPGALNISKEEEKKRLFSALDLLSDQISIPISVDTMYADVADGALNRGASIINDISGLKADEKMAATIAEYDAGAVLMATHKKPGDPLGMSSVFSALTDSISTAERAGIDSQKIILDPAVGHWIPEKTAEYDFDIINRFEAFQSFEKPLLIAVSRKSFLNSAVLKPANERLIPSLIAASIAAYKGGHIVRTHDVSETVEAMKIVSFIAASKKY